MEIHDRSAAIADYFALPAWRRLQIVLVEMDGKRPAGRAAFHQDTRCVLYVDLKIAPLSAQRIDLPGHAEERVQIIELMNLGENHATAQIGARRIHLPVILVRMPVR